MATDSAAPAPPGDPWTEAGLPPLQMTLLIHRCSRCGLGAVVKADMDKHMALPKCKGARAITAACAVVDPRDPSDKRPRQRPGGIGNTSIAGDHNNVDVNVQIIEQLVIVTNGPLGDVVRAGTPLEAELIRKTLLENGSLRQMVRTIENAPAAMFKLTKGAQGAQVLRNARKSGNRVAELREGGVETSGVIEYCKRTALAMVQELQRVVAGVDEASPEATRQWAADVRAALTAQIGGGCDYVAALKLYCDASTRFYKLPAAARAAISGGVRDIAAFICETASF